MNYPYCTLELSPIDENRDLIVNAKCNILIEVFFESRDSFVLEPKEIQYYGDDHGDRLIFQTIGYNGDNLSDIELSIMWYAAIHLDYPEMELLKKN